MGLRISSGKIQSPGTLRGPRRSYSMEEVWLRVQGLGRSLFIERGWISCVTMDGGNLAPRYIPYTLGITVCWGS